ncbi:MAG: sugar phosphate isomerase/epimerase family protein [Planctomycetota bacterium]
MDPARRALLAIPFAAPLARFGGLLAPPRISLAQWSFHRALRSGELAHLDFAAHARKEFGLEGVEYVNQFFADKACDFAYLAEMKKRASDAGVESLLIMVDGEGALGAADLAERRTAIEKHFRWIAAAAYLGCHSVRVNLEGSGAREAHARQAAESLHRLGVVADGYRVNVIVENHGGYSSDGEWLAIVMKVANHPRVGTLPDFGNFTIGEGKTYDRYKGIAELIPYAKALSAKSFDFDAEGNETTIDYFRMAKIARDAGYGGWVGVEYEGNRLSEAEGVRKTIDLVRRAWAG